MNELIVEFRAGVSEDDARAAVVAVGAQVRRRMRSDGAIMLLVKLGSDPAQTRDRVANLPKVARVEDNDDGYGPRS
ncbi:MAG: hypothetical protein U1E65_08395 [Myxococcota bacterium]